MRDQIQGKQSLAISETNSEWEKNDVAQKATDTELSKTHQRRSASITPPGNELGESQAQSSAIEAKLRRRRFKFSGALRAAHRECSESESPLKGTPWEDAMRFSSVPLSSYSSSPQRYRKLTRQRSAKEEECIDFWLKFFG